MRLEVGTSRRSPVYFGEVYSWRVSKAYTAGKKQYRIPVKVLE